MKKEFTIQETAKITGLSVHTLRYYERIGLLDPVNRTALGYRKFSLHDIAWVEFLNRLRTTGMPIRRMQQFADLRRQGVTTIRERRSLLEDHQKEVQTRVIELQKSLQAIHDKIHHYKQLEDEEDGK